MKVFIIAALTADGLIARDSHHLAVSWTSKADKKHFVRLSKEAGHMVMGANQYATINRGLPGRQTYVYSTDPISAEGVEVVTEEPAQLVARLAGQGVEQLAICGGAMIYDMFIHAGVVDELYLTIEPTLFGAGLSLFKNSLELSLELKDVRQEDNSVFLHYIVQK